MQLHLGTMTNQELAAWFGLTEGSFKNTKKKRLQELKEDYCDFEVLRGKINVIKIYDEKKINYVNKKSRVYKFICNNMDKVWNENGLDSCKDVTEKFLKEHEAEMEDYSDTVVYSLVIAARNELYGKPFMRHEGKLGYCEYIWCTRDEEGELRFLTEDEEKRKELLLKKYYGDAQEKTLFVKEMVKRGEIKEEEAWRYYDELNGGDGSFYGLMRDMREYGVNLVKGTLVTRNGISYLVEVE